MDVFLKVLSDMDCSLFIDGEFVQIINADSIPLIRLAGLELLQTHPDILLHRVPVQAQLMGNLRTV